MGSPLTGKVSLSETDQSAFSVIQGYRIRCGAGNDWRWPLKLNKLRLKHEIDSPEFAQADLVLRDALDTMEQPFESELTEEKIHPEKAKRLNSIKAHWEGLQVFVDYPWIPMDNSEAERKRYTAALGRKNYYGSGSKWSGEFTASLFSIFQTLKLWKLNS